MVALNVEGRDILDMKVSLHVNPYIVEDYPFEQSHRNLHDQQNEDSLDELEGDDLLHELEEDDFLLELQEDHFEQILIIIMINKVWIFQINWKIMMIC